MNQTFNKFLALLSLAWLAGSAAANASDWVVLKTMDTPTLPARGEILSTAHEIKLLPEHLIIVIHRNGTVVRLTGPYSGTLSEHPDLSEPKHVDKDVTALGVVSNLLKNNDRLISTLGSTRDPDTGKRPARSANPWQPYVGASNIYCIDADETIIRRHNTEQSVRVILVSPDVEVLPQKWPEGQETLRLERISNGKHATYDLLISDRPGRSKLIIRPANQSENRMEQIAWMADVGCITQALQLVDLTLQQEQPN